MKCRIKIEDCGEWGDPYPVGIMYSIKINGKKIGTSTSVDRELLREAYTKGYEDAKKEVRS